MNTCFEGRERIRVVMESKFKIYAVQKLLLVKILFDEIGFKTVF